MEEVENTTRRKRPLRRRKWPWILLAAVVSFLVFIGPWPTYLTGYEGTGYATATFARLEAMPLVSTTGPLRAGAAAADITPPVGEPLAGYSARKPKESVGVHDRLFAKAISLSNGQKTVTIVGGDILLILPELRDAILQRVNLPREDVYFTATHTHSGPGGYSSRWVDQISLGTFDRKIRDRLADAFAEVIRQSRGELRPAEVRFSRGMLAPGPAGELVRNRLTGSPGHGTLGVWSFEGLDGNCLGSLTVFSGHPTCFGTGSRAASADYPGGVQQVMEEQFGGVAMFAAGAVGGVECASEQPRGEPRSRDVARRVGQWAVALAQGGRGAVTSQAPAGLSSLYSNGLIPTETGLHYVGRDRRELALVSAVLPVDLPSQQFHITEHLRLSPFAASYLHGGKTYLHLLRVNEAVLLGMPCDYSGELAERLEWKDAESGVPHPREGLIPIITSFNGDYMGYLTPRVRDDQSGYETRTMSLFGPWCGEYFDELSYRLLKRLGAARAP